MARSKSGLAIFSLQLLPLRSLTKYEAAQRCEIAISSRHSYFASSHLPDARSTGHLCHRPVVFLHKDAKPERLDNHRDLQQWPDYVPSRCCRWGNGEFRFDNGKNSVHVDEIGDVEVFPKGQTAGALTCNIGRCTE